MFMFKRSTESTFVNYLLIKCRLSLKSESPSENSKGVHLEDYAKVVSYKDYQAFLIEYEKDQEKIRKKRARKTTTTTTTG